LKASVDVGILDLSFRKIIKNSATIMGEVFEQAGYLRVVKRTFERGDLLFDPHRYS